MADLDAAEESAKALFEMTEAYPRFKELGLDPLHAADERGAMVLRGPLKLLQTVSKLTCAGDAADVSSRFRVLLSRAKWVKQAEVEEMLSGVVGSDGIGERLAAYDPTREYAAIVIAELDDLPCCWHMVGGGYPESMVDSGPWMYVMDHGRARSGRRPGYSYIGTLRPHRVSPRRAVPDHIFKPDYYIDGEPVAEMSAPAKSTPPILTAAQAQKVREPTCRTRISVDYGILQTVHIRVVHPRLAQCQLTFLHRRTEDDIVYVQAESEIQCFARPLRVWPLQDNVSLQGSCA